MKLSHYCIGLLACLCMFNAACSSTPELQVSEAAPEPEPIVVELPEPESIVVELPEPEPVVVELPEPEPIVVEPPEPEPIVVEPPEPEPIVVEPPPEPEPIVVELPEPEPVVVEPPPEPEPIVVELPEPEPSIEFTLEAALRRSCDTLIETLPDTSSIALISIASDNLKESEFAVKELSFLLLDSRVFNLVERRTLDPIMRERHFQLAGEVDDTSALSIGYRTGAEIVMTGVISVHESEKYLRLRAIDVESKEILALTSEFFID